MNNVKYGVCIEGKGKVPQVGTGREPSLPCVSAGRDLSKLLQ